MTVKFMMNLFALLCSSAAIASAVPNISGVEVAQDETSKLVTISYCLSDAPGIVTFSLETNASEDVWLPIDGSDLAGAWGDVNMLVTPKEEGKHTIFWQPNISNPAFSMEKGNVRAVLTAWQEEYPPDYMVIDLNCGRPADGGPLAHGHSFYADANQLPFGISNKMYKTSKLVMRRIPVSPDLKWVMGQADVDNATPHYVTLTNSFYIGVYEITYGQWENICHNIPSTTSKYGYTNFTDVSSMPVCGVMFTEVRGSSKGLGWFSDKDAVTRRDVDANTPISNLRLRTGILFDLPTEAQWEYACRAGESTSFNNGTDSIGETAWYKQNSLATTVRGDKLRAIHEVGTRNSSNNWGLYDMHGNVREMCLDVWRNDLGADDVKEPLGAPYTGVANTDKFRVFRGGCFSDSADACRSSYRTYTNVKAHYTSNGFRVVCPYPLGLNW